MEFFVGCQSRERKRALGEKGAFVGSWTRIFMAKGTHLAIIGKSAPEKIIE
jgi:hypothetical protein